MMAHWEIRAVRNVLSRGLFLSSKGRTVMMMLAAGPIEPSAEVAAGPENANSVLMVPLDLQRKRQAARPSSRGLSGWTRTSPSATLSWRERQRANRYDGPRPMPPHGAEIALHCRK